MDSKSLQWKPYLTKDLQVEFVMLDPWVRAPLELTNAKTGTYQASFYVHKFNNVGAFQIRNLLAV